MPFKVAGAAMADVWSIPLPGNEPTPPPSPAPTPPASVKGEDADPVKPVPTPSQTIKDAAVEATVAAAAPPVPPATTNGFSEGFFVAYDEKVNEARDLGIEAAKQAGYFTAQAAAYRAGKLGDVDAESERDAAVADSTADIYADLAATAALSACVTRASAIAGAYTTTVTYQYDQVADKVKRNIQDEHDEAAAMRAEFLSEFPLPPKF